MLHFLDVCQLFIKFAALLVCALLLVGVGWRLARSPGPIVSEPLGAHLVQHKRMGHHKGLVRVVGLRVDRANGLQGLYVAPMDAGRTGVLVKLLIVD